MSDALSTLPGAPGRTAPGEAGTDPLARLAAAVDRLEVVLDAAQDQAAAERLTATRLLDAARDEAEAARAGEAEARRQAQALVTQAEEAERRANDHARQLAEADQEVVQLRQETAQLRQEAAQLRQEMTRLEAARAQLGQALSAAETRLGGTADVEARAQATERTLAEALDEARAARDGALDEAERLGLELDRLAATEQALRDDLTALTLALEAERAARQAAQTALEEAAAAERPELEAISDRLAGVMTRLERVLGHS